MTYPTLSSLYLKLLSQLVPKFLREEGEERERDTNKFLSGWKAQIQMHTASYHVCNECNASGPLSHRRFRYRSCIDYTELTHLLSQFLMLDMKTSRWVDDPS